jgi:hypothetical protein
MKPIIIRLCSYDCTAHFDSDTVDYHCKVLWFKFKLQYKTIPGIEVDTWYF